MIENGRRFHTRSLHRVGKSGFAVIGGSHELYVVQVYSRDVERGNPIRPFDKLRMEG